MSESDEPARAAMLAIGDELLSGRTRDANIPALARALGGRGIALAEARIVADEREAIVEAVHALRARARWLFTSGGIGPTHDDITAEAVAAAFGVPLVEHPEARAALEAHYGAEITPARLRMARLPEGARPIANRLTAAPGFRIRNLFVMAGVPQIFAAMLNEVIPHLARAAPMLSRALTVDAPESELAGQVAQIAAEHPQVSVGSYPAFSGHDEAQVTLVVRGRAHSAVEAALARLAAAIEKSGYTYRVGDHVS